MSLENIDSIRICPAAEFVPTERERLDVLPLIIDEYDRRLDELTAQSGDKKTS